MMDLHEFYGCNYINLLASSMRYSKNKRLLWLPEAKEYYSMQGVSFSQQCEDVLNAADAVKVYVPYFFPASFD